MTNLAGHRERVFSTPHPEPPAPSPGGWTLHLRGFANPLMHVCSIYRHSRIPGDSATRDKAEGRVRWYPHPRQTTTAPDRADATTSRADPIGSSLSTSSEPVSGRGELVTPGVEPIGLSLSGRLPRPAPGRADATTSGVPPIGLSLSPSSIEADAAARGDAFSRDLPHRSIHSPSRESVRSPALLPVWYPAIVLPRGPVPPASRQSPSHRRPTGQRRSVSDPDGDRKSCQTNYELQIRINRIRNDDVPSHLPGPGRTPRPEGARRLDRRRPTSRSRVGLEAMPAERLRHRPQTCTLTAHEARVGCLSWKSSIERRAGQGLAGLPARRKTSCVSTDAGEGVCLILRRPGSNQFRTIPASACGLGAPNAPSVQMSTRPPQIDTRAVEQPTTTPRASRHTDDVKIGVRTTVEKLFFSRRSSFFERRPHTSEKETTIRRCCGGAVRYRGAGGVARHPTHPTHRNGGSGVGEPTLAPPDQWGGWSWRCST